MMYSLVSLNKFNKYAFKLNVFILKGETKEFGIDWSGHAVPEFFGVFETYRFLLKKLKVMFPFSTDTVTLCLNVFE